MPLEKTSRVCPVVLAILLGSYLSWCCRDSVFPRGHCCDNIIQIYTPYFNIAIDVQTIPHQCAIVCCSF